MTMRPFQGRCHICRHDHDAETQRWCDVLELATRADGMPASANERHLRRLLAVRVGMTPNYYDDGEAQGQEHGIVIDFMREPVADIDAKLRALNVARVECAKPLLTPDQCDGLRMVLAHYAGDPRVMPLAALLDAARSKTPNVNSTTN